MIMAALMRLPRIKIEKLRTGRGEKKISPKLVDIFRHVVIAPARHKMRKTTL